MKKNLSFPGCVLQISFAFAMINHIRFLIFHTNLHLVKEHNSAHNSFTVEINKFTTRTQSEYRLLLVLRNQIFRHQTQKKSSKSVNHESLNWKDKLIVVSIDD